MNPEELSTEQLEQLYEAAARDPAVLDAVTDDPELWRALSKVARDHKRARYGRVYYVVWPIEWTVIWVLRIITAPFRGYV